MNRAKFSEGEVVILQSISQPWNNGEYTVHRVLTKDSEYNCRISGKLLKRSRDGVGYLLSELVSHSDQHPERECPWSELALRKKYDGCGQDYNEMIKSLNLDIVEVV